MENLDILKEKIDNELGKIIKGKCCLIDIPTHRNIGDLLIWQGEMDFIKEHNIDLKFYTSIDSFIPEQITSDMTILLHGGGNFGDIWEKHHNFRKEFIPKFKDNKIIIFPQTTHFINNDELKVTIDIFSKHKDLTLCARDLVTFEFMKKNFVKNKIILLPDMALCSRYINDKKQKTKKVLYIVRKDKELVKQFDTSYIKNVEIKDWPTFKEISYYNFSHKARKVLWLVKHHIQKALKISVNKDTFASKNRKKYIEVGRKFMLSYDLVITNRLHGQIFCSLLRIPSIMLSNSYGKNENFHNSWLKNDPLCHFAKDEKELKKIINKHFPEVLKN